MLIRRWILFNANYVLQCMLNSYPSIFDHFSKTCCTEEKKDTKIATAKYSAKKQKTNCFMMTTQACWISLFYQTFCDKVAFYPHTTDMCTNSICRQSDIWSETDILPQSLLITNLVWKNWPSPFHFILISMHFHAKKLT